MQVLNTKPHMYHVDKLYITRLDPSELAPAIASSVITYSNKNEPVTNRVVLEHIVPISGYFGTNCSYNVFFLFSTMLINIVFFIFDPYFLIFLATILMSMATNFIIAAKAAKKKTMPHIVIV